MSDSPCIADLLKKTIGQAPGDSHCQLHQCSLPDHTVTIEGQMYHVAGDCPHCLTDRQQDERRTAMQARFTHMGIPPRYHGRRVCDFQATTPAQRSVLQIARRFCGRDGDAFTSDDERNQAPAYDSLVLLGNVGTGKTLLACGILTDWTHAEDGTYTDTGLYSTAGQLLRRMKMSWRKESPETEHEVFTKLGKPSLLVIDELGVQFNSDAERCLLTELINDRYNAQRRTILVSNLTLQEFTSVVGERVVDRCRENGKVLSFDWASQRGTRQPKANPTC